MGFLRVRALSGSGDCRDGWEEIRKGGIEWFEDFMLEIIEKGCL